jgi:hypothetical protein
VGPVTEARRGEAIPTLTLMGLGGEGPYPSITLVVTWSVEVVLKSLSLAAKGNGPVAAFYAGLWLIFCIISDTSRQLSFQNSQILTFAIAGSQANYETCPVTKERTTVLNGELITKAATMEKMGIGEPTNEDLVDQMHHILEDFASFRIELRAR